MDLELLPPKLYVTLPLFKVQSRLLEEYKIMFSHWYTSKQIDKQSISILIGEIYCIFPMRKSVIAFSKQYTAYTSNPTCPAQLSFPTIPTTYSGSTIQSFKFTFFTFIYILIIQHVVHTITNIYMQLHACNFASFSFQIIISSSARNCA